MQYPIAIYKNHDTFYVSIPDIPKLTEIQGKDVAEAIYNARLTVSEHLYDLLQQDCQFPEPTAISAHVSNPDYAGYIWAVVSIEMSRIMGETAELTIRLPVRLVSELHHSYPNRDINQIILDALKGHLEK